MPFKKGGEVEQQLWLKPFTYAAHTRHSMVFKTNGVTKLIHKVTFSQGHAKLVG